MIVGRLHKQGVQPLRARGTEVSTPLASIVRALLNAMIATRIEVYVYIENIYMYITESTIYIHLDRCPSTHLCGKEVPLVRPPVRIAVPTVACTPHNQPHKQSISRRIQELHQSRAASNSGFI